MKPTAILVAALLGFLATAAVAEPVKAGALVIEQAWSRSTAPAAKTGAVYLTIRNTGTQPDRVASIATPVAGHVMVHETKQDGDVLRMHEAGPLGLPPGGVMEMKPSGTHLMLMDVKGALKPGQEFPLIVTFEKAGPVQVPVKVGRPGAMGPE